jgi:hypothetical protein
MRTSRSRLAPAVAFLVLLPAAVLRGDVWDVQTQSDNTTATENELVHGSDQVHDLGALAPPAADEDWYRLSQKPYSSYEVVVDATSGDVGQTLSLDLIDVNGSSVVQSGISTGIGFSRTLRFRNLGASAVDGQWVRIRSGSCTTDCGSDDVYRVRAYDTTYAVPRFNNSSSQVTVLLLQNPGSASVDLTVNFWSSAGTLLDTYTPSSPLGPKGLLVVNTSAVAGASGQSGAMTVTHTAGYGGLAGKTVALEPATGFSFDTPMIPVPH